MRTFGVEEELLLIDPVSRSAVPRSSSVASAEAGVEVELFRHVVEVQTPPAETLEDLELAVRRSRARAAAEASTAGLILAASGTSPLRSRDAEVTDDDRYREMVETFADVARRGGTCGLHVHVSVDSDEEGVDVIDRLSPWLPLVLAVSANSPFAQGHDTGYASWRLQQWDSWPSAGPTQPFGSVAAYRRAGDDLVASGAARDRHMLYFDARLAEDYPTVEVRIADVTTDVRDTALVAALVRGLVGRAADDARRSRPLVAWRTDLLRAARWRASRFGLGSRLLDPLTGTPVEAAQALESLLAHIRPVLDEHGDTDHALAGVARVLAGTGSTLQRRAFEAAGSFEGVVDDLVLRSEPGADTQA